jgi:ABC-type transport system substrate-binding protein
MKKFEVVFNDSNYDYVTRNMILEYLQGAFTKADIKVKTVRKSNGKQERKKSR